MLIIGIAGGSGSGKTTVVKKIVKHFAKDQVAIISQDAYYRDNGHLSPDDKRKINFDHPDAIEFELLIQHLDQLRQGQTISMPVYSYITCGRAKETISIQPKDVLIVEGILVLSNEAMRQRMDIKVFVDADSDDRLMRIVKRDTQERGRDYLQAMEHYEKTVKPMHQLFIETAKRYADIIIPQGGQNLVAIRVLSHCIQSHLSGQLALK